MNVQDFLRDVEKHQINVLRDDGLYRHIRFRRPDTSAYFFDLITWPGALCYTGDMGTFVFSRLADMFEFFRTDRTELGELYINPGYWSEKLLAVDGNRQSASAMEFSEEEFTKVINEQVEDWLDERDVSEGDAEELREAVKDDIIRMIEPQDESYSYRLAYEFRHEVAGEEFSFTDLFDYNFRTFTRTFLWCCYALSWSIQKYDEHKAPPTDKNQIDMAEVWEGEK